MAVSTINSDLRVAGTVIPDGLQPPAGCISDNAVAQPGGAVVPINATKIQHQVTATFAQATGSDATAETRTIFVAHAACVVDDIRISNIVSATGADTATIDVKKNGTTSVLSATVSVAAASPAAYASVAGSLGVTDNITLAAGDTLTAYLTVSHTTGTLPQGICVYITLNTNP